MQETIPEEPMEMSLEDGNSTQQLKELLAKKAKEKLQLESLNSLTILKKSKFYYGNNGELREHIASYKNYAILIKQELIKEKLDEKNNTMFPSLVTLDDLKKMKKVNGNTVKKIQPDSIHEHEKLALLIKVVPEIDKGI